MPSQPVGPARTDFPFWWRVPVRWGDMDALGHVNNCIFLRYIECARVGYFEAMGWSSGSGQDTGGVRYGPIIVSQTFNYRRQVRYPADLDIGVRCSEIRNRSFVLSYAVYPQASHDLLGDGYTILVWLDFLQNKAIEIPTDLREYLIRTAEAPPPQSASSV